MPITISMSIMSSVLGMMAATTGIALVGLGRARSSLADLSGENARLRQEAAHDPLTGLANRRSILRTLETALSRPHSATAVLYVDLDHFKSINDSLGHRCGDHVLVEMAERLRTHLPVGATPGRLGGDELVIVLPDVHSLEEAADVASDLHRSLSRPIQVETGSVPVRLTVSIGVAMSHTGEVAGDGTACTTGSGDAAMMLDCADRALRRAKLDGRNRVLVAELP